MIYQIANILHDVRVCLDQNVIVEALLTDSDEDTLRLDEVIRSKILEGVERVHCAAPYHLLEQGHDFSENGIFWKDDDTCGFLLLPDDFMRLVVFEMSDWERAVYAAITPADPQYAKQRSRVKGVRGNAQRPVCALGVHPAGRTLEFYSCKSQEATVTKAVYIPYPIIEDSSMDGETVEGIDISELCYPAVVYMVAGLTLTTCGEQERATIFYGMSKTYLEK